MYFRRAQASHKPLLAAAFALILMSWAAPLRAVEPGSQPWQKTRFLETFFHNDAVSKIDLSEVKFEAVGREETGWLARPKVSERLPAVLLVPAGPEIDERTRSAAYHIATTGFVVLAVKNESQRAAAGSTLVQQVTEGQGVERLAAALDWLAKRDDVDRVRLGAFGWDGGALAVLDLCQRRELQGAVVQAGLDEPLAARLKVCHVPVLVLAGGRAAGAAERAADLQKQLQAAKLPHRISLYANADQDLMWTTESEGPVAESREFAWVELYEFLGHHVEDAAVDGAAEPSDPASKPVARIADIMRVINSTEGVRGQLARGLAEEPQEEKAWTVIRSQAAVMAEAGTLLSSLTPHNGNRAAWPDQVRQYRKVAVSLVEAIDDRNYTVALDRLQQLGATCADCHKQFR
jgi:carboxymethylenebutenolidase